MSGGDDRETTRAWLALMTKKAWHRSPSNVLEGNRKTWNVYCEGIANNDNSDSANNSCIPSNCAPLLEARCAVSLRPSPFKLHVCTFTSSWPCLLSAPSSSDVSAQSKKREWEPHVTVQSQQTKHASSGSTHRDFGLPFFPFLLLDLLLPFRFGHPFWNTSAGV